MLSKATADAAKGASAEAAKSLWALHVRQL